MQKPGDAGRLARQKGGIARRERLTPLQRSQIATTAAQARWNRDKSVVDLTEIEGLQMNTDAIDAADILVTELNEQEAMLSQSGVAALSSGQLAAAKIIIAAIEQTQALRNRAEGMKGEIEALYSSIIPASEPGKGGGALVHDLESREASDRRQDRTDPVLMNQKRNQILLQLESKYDVRFHRRSAAVYRSDDGELGIVCTMSKWHSKNENYWYAYHPHQDEFLSTTRRGYFVLGMMDLSLAVSLPVEVVRQNLDKLNTTTTPDGRSYWHIHISRSRNSGLSLQRARGEPPLPLDRYIVQLKA